MAAAEGGDGDSAAYVAHVDNRATITARTRHMVSVHSRYVVERSVCAVEQNMGYVCFRSLHPTYV